MSNQIIIQPQEISVIIKQEPKQLILQPLPFPQIIIKGVQMPANIKPFSLVTIQNGQTVFTLPYTYSVIICLFIMGTGQDPIAGDYSLSGNIVTLGDTAPTMQIGDLLFGSGQI